MARFFLDNDAVAGSRQADGSFSMAVEQTVGAATSAPVTGTLNATGYSATPFVPQLARPIWLNAIGTFQGRVWLARSIDGGATKQLFQCSSDGFPITSIWGNGAVSACLQGMSETSARATYYVYAELTSGSVAYEIHQ